MTFSRREFISSSATILAASILPSQFLEAKNKNYVGIQLWSVKDAMEKNPKETLATLAKMGYNEVEAFGWDYFGMQPKPFKQYIESLGLKMRSAHGALMKKNPNDPTPTNLQESIDRAKEAGLTYYIVPWMEADNYATKDACLKTAEYFNLYGELCKKSDLQLLYHNHEFEFKMIENKSVYDLILENTDSNYLKCELDLYWATIANINPIDLFQKYPQRFPLWHVKDKHKTLRESTEVGNGMINFKKIFEKATLAGLKMPVLEQEDYQGKSSIKSAKICINNFNKITYSL